MQLHEEALAFLVEVSDGDARRALTALEIGVLSSSERPLQFTRELALESVQRKAVAYDGDGDAHYDTASALIKSIRGSDPDAALYWLARMLEGGEDIKFIAEPVLNHRLILTPEAEMEGRSVQNVCNKILDKIEVPR